MNRNVLTVLFFATLLLQGGTVFGSAPIAITAITTQAQLDSVMQVSKATGKTVYLDVSTTWCGYCRRLHRQVYTDSAVAAYFNTHFINITIDGDQPLGKEIARIYGVRGFPTLLFLNGDGGVVHRVNGYVEPAVFLSHGRRASERAQ
jgi:thioredoxin 1